MTAAAVGSNTRKRLFAVSPAGHQDPTGRVEHIARKGKMQRGVTAVHARLRCRPGGRAVRGAEDHTFLISHLSTCPFSAPAAARPRRRPAGTGRTEGLSAKPGAAGAVARAATREWGGGAGDARASD